MLGSFSSPLLILPCSSVLASVVCVLLWGVCFVIFGAYSSGVPLVLCRWFSVLGLGLCSVCYGCPVLVLLVRSLGCVGTGVDIATNTAAAAAIATVCSVFFVRGYAYKHQFLGVATDTGTGTAIGGMMTRSDAIMAWVVLVSFVDPSLVI